MHDYNNGIFINLNWIPDETLININNYIEFCIKSHNEINKYEDICTILNNSINTKDKTEDISIADINDNKVITNIIKQKISSSMKFYLLKKKFLKQNIIISNNINNQLTHEEYLF